MTMAVHHESTPGLTERVMERILTRINWERQADRTLEFDPVEMRKALACFWAAAIASVICLGFTGIGQGVNALIYGGIFIILFTAQGFAYWRMAVSWDAREAARRRALLRDQDLDGDEEPARSVTGSVYVTPEPLRGGPRRYTDDEIILFVREICAGKTGESYWANHPSLRLPARQYREWMGMLAQWGIVEKPQVPGGRYSAKVTFARALEILAEGEAPAVRAKYMEAARSAQPQFIAVGPRTLRDTRPGAGPSPLPGPYAGSGPRPRSVEVDVEAVEAVEADVEDGEEYPA